MTRRSERQKREKDTEMETEGEGEARPREVNDSPPPSPSPRTQENKALESEEDTKSMDSASTLDNDNFVRQQQQRPERMTARQRAMVGDVDGATSGGLLRLPEFEGGLEERRLSLFLSPKKKPVTEEDLIRKAEQNEQRRKRAAKKRRETLLTVEQSIREGKGARQKREDRLQEQRSERLAKRKLGGSLPPGMVRISVKKHQTQVIWHEDSELPLKELHSKEKASSSFSSPSLVIRVETSGDFDMAAMSSLKCGGPVEVRLMPPQNNNNHKKNGKEDPQQHRVFALEKVPIYLGLVPKQFSAKVLTTSNEASSKATGGYIKSLNRSKRMIDIRVACR